MTNTRGADDDGQDGRFQRVSSPGRFASLGWSLAPFANIAAIDSTDHIGFGTPTKYPFRYARYWFMYHYLEELCARRGRALRVCEVGVHNGQMLAFMGGAPNAAGGLDLPGSVAAWTAVDVHIDETRLRRYGYTDTRCLDVETAWDLEPEAYDAIVLLHVLEHLHEPERTMRVAARSLRPGGCLIGGAPAMPDWLARRYQPRLRAKAGRFGHVSTFSPARIRRAARELDMRLEHLAGAFAVRLSGRAIENSALWLRLNLAFGTAFPSLGSEVYFMMTRRS